MDIRVESLTEMRIKPTSDVDASILRAVSVWHVEIDKRDPFALGTDELVLRAGTAETVNEVNDE